MRLSELECRNIQGAGEFSRVLLDMEWEIGLRSSFDMVCRVANNH